MMLERVANLPAAPSEDFYHLSFCEDFEAENLQNGTEVDPVHLMMSNELGRIVSENMLLQEKLDRQNKQLRDSTRSDHDRSSADRSIDSILENCDDSVRLRTLSTEIVEHSALLQIEDLTSFVRILVPDLKPRIAALVTPCLPSYLFLMGFRYFDHANDEAGLSRMFSAIHSNIKNTVETSQDLDVLGLWLVNTWRLLNLLKQYSGKGEADTPQVWSASNTAKQSEHTMHKFDLSPLREKLKLRVEDSYRNFMKRAVEPVLSPKVVPAILQHEPAKEVLGVHGSVRKTPSQTERVSERALADLIEFLNFVHSKLWAFGADAALLSQVFSQIVQWVCALALNHLMFRRELCNFERAFQIKHNVTEISAWLDDRGFRHLKEILEPLIQASHLLQSRKDAQYVDDLCGEMTSKLKPKQIVTLLKHYSPSDGFEPRLPAEFLQKVTDRLTELRNPQVTSILTAEDDDSDLKGGRNPLLVSTHAAPIDTNTFSYSEVALEKIGLPSCLKLADHVRLL